MNLLLLEAHEQCATLPREDRRAKHILEILGRRVGDTVNAGIVNGPVGMATISAIRDGSVSLEFAAVRETESLPRISLIIGLPRPPTARDILRDATTCGVEAMHFVRTEHTDKSYGGSKLWMNDAWREFVLLGASQAHDTRLPIVTSTHTLASALEMVAPTRMIALDNYDTQLHLAAADVTQKSPTTLAFGPERGWSARDRGALRAAGAAFHHLGARALRVEMAVVAALAVVAARGAAP